MVKIIQMFIPKSNKRTRPGRRMTPTSITDHETDNNHVRANALAHARLQQNGNPRQASWHLQIDDEPEVYQSIPFNEVAYHAGNSTGNNTSIGVERCVNRDGNYVKTVNNAVKVYRMLLKTYPSITRIVQHNHWSGKHCPRKMREGHKGINWNEFVKRVRSELDVAKPIKPVKPTYVTSNNKVNLKQKVTIKNSATRYATGEKIPSHIKGKTYTVQQRGSNRVLLKEILSWVRISDLGGLGSTSNKTNSNPKPGTNPTVQNIQKKLNRYKINNIAVDNISGRDTYRAMVKAYQYELNRQFDAGLVVDGIPGAKTDAAAVTLRYSETKGNLAKLTQGMLILHGFRTTFDGYWQNGSIATMKDFQRANGLKDDGVPGRLSYAKLIRF